MLNDDVLIEWRGEDLIEGDEVVVEVVVAL